MNRNQFKLQSKSKELRKIAAEKGDELAVKGPRRPTRRLLDEQRQKMIEDNFYYARNLAFKYTLVKGRPDMTLDDLQGEALYGLCVAAARFDESGNTKFSSFAHYRIVGAMEDLLRQRMRKRRLFSADEGNHLEHAQSAPEPLKKYRRPKVLPPECVGIITCSNRNQNELDFANPEDDTPESFSDRARVRATLLAALERLSARERTIVLEHYFCDKDFVELRPNLGGISKAAISRAHAEALHKLKTHLQEAGHDFDNLLSDAA